MVPEKIYGFATEGEAGRESVVWLNERRAKLAARQLSLVHKKPDRLSPVGFSSRGNSSNELYNNIRFRWSLQANAMGAVARKQAFVGLLAVLPGDCDFVRSRIDHKRARTTAVQLKPIAHA
jgi:hypothetical protein